MKVSCKTALLLLFAIFFVVLLEQNKADAAGPKCQVSELMPCEDALSKGSKPSPDCCKKLNEQQPCLCKYLSDDKLKPIVNSRNAKKIGKECKVPDPKC